MSNKQAFEMLIKTLYRINSTSDMELILNCILTKKEIEDISDRLNIYNELINSKSPQREIACNLGVSISKITRGAANLQDKKIEDFLKNKIFNN
ncbi:trp operon repressor [Vibrio sp.]|uniref:trp operon repressor n=1 Tax=Vibrio sp. TaxID=678 RepID=UPI0031202E68